MKELTEEVMDEVGDTMAVSIRLSLQELGDQYSLTNKDILRLSSPDLTANNLLDTTKPVGLVFAQANTRQELITKLDAIAISFWQQFYQT